MYDFRRAIQDLTNVPPDRQKLVGLVKGSGKLSNDLDGMRFGNLETKKGDVKFTMIGTPEDQSFVDPVPMPDVSQTFSGPLQYLYMGLSTRSPMTSMSCIRLYNRHLEAAVEGSKHRLPLRIRGTSAKSRTSSAPVRSRLVSYLSIEYAS